VAGQWNQIASVAAQQHGNSLAQDAKLFTELNVGLADTGIATSNAKYNFNFWSPVTALQNASQAGNPAIQADPNFQSLITTPEAPEYVETQSAFSSAAATILDNAFGSNVAFTATASNLPGVARSFSSFDQAAAEAGRSGIYAGTDFQFSNVAGQGLGSQVGSLVVHSFDFTKTTNPPKIVLDQANPNIVTNKNPTITGDVFSISGNVASLSVSIDGAKATALSFDQNGRFSLPLNFALNGTQDGAHSVTLVATDSLGNQSGASTIHVTLATSGPKLSIASLQDGASIADGAVLQGNATSPVAITSLCYKFDNGTVIPVRRRHAVGVLRRQRKPGIRWPNGEFVWRTGEFRSDLQYRCRRVDLRGSQRRPRRNDCGGLWRSTGVRQQSIDPCTDYRLDHRCWQRTGKRRIVRRRRYFHLCGDGHDDGEQRDDLLRWTGHAGRARSHRQHTDRLGNRHRDGLDDARRRAAVRIGQDGDAGRTDHR
jgi:hypothetical protein